MCPEVVTQKVLYEPLAPRAELEWPSSANLRPTNPITVAGVAVWPQKATFVHLAKYHMTGLLESKGQTNRLVILVSVRHGKERGDFL